MIFRFRTHLSTALKNPVLFGRIQIHQSFKISAKFKCFPWFDRQHIFLKRSILFPTNIFTIGFSPRCKSLSSSIDDSTSRNVLPCSDAGMNERNETLSDSARNNFSFRGSPYSLIRFSSMTQSRRMPSPRNFCLFARSCTDASPFQETRYLDSLSENPRDFRVFPISHNEKNIHIQIPHIFAFAWMNFYAGPPRSH